MRLPMLSLSSEELDTRIRKATEPYSQGLGLWIQSAYCSQGQSVHCHSMSDPSTSKHLTGLLSGIDSLIAAGVGFALGFAAGLLYGLTHGQGFGGLLTALEAGLLGAVGILVGWDGGLLVGATLGALFDPVAGSRVGGTIGAIAGATLVGANAIMSGIHGIYKWHSWKGWLAFLTDHSWAIISIAPGGLVHIINTFWQDSNYRHDLSNRENRHIYERGLCLRRGFAFTQGNVISNASSGGGGIDLDFLNEHETLHIWQSRVFGPLLEATYIVWGIGGFIVASIYWLFSHRENWRELVREAAYFDNPFEYWAFKNNDNWPPKPGNAGLLWT